jgi:hypothetical protein
MIRQDLLDKELDYYRKLGKELKPVKFNRDHIFNLFKKYQKYGMTESSYCCHGEEQCCWIEVVEDGNWELTLPKIRRNILYLFNNIKYELRSRRIYGNRMYMYQDKECCHIYIYSRDLFDVDYDIWFKKK